jgi:hypothetical protein
MDVVGIRPIIEMDRARTENKIAVTLVQHPFRTAWTFAEPPQRAAGPDAVLLAATVADI